MCNLCSQFAIASRHLQSSKQSSPYGCAAAIYVSLCPGLHLSATAAAQWSHSSDSWFEQQRTQAAGMVAGRMLWLGLQHGCPWRHDQADTLRPVYDRLEVHRGAPTNLPGLLRSSSPILTPHYACAEYALLWMLRPGPFCSLV